MTTATLVCERATRAYPDGRTGTNAGYQAHEAVTETPCEACTKANRAVQRGQYERHRDAVKARARRYRHGMTREEYDALLASQGGGCAVCGTTEPGGSAGYYFHVDHDHACCPGRNSCSACIRGLLCAACNVGLGAFRDNPDRLMAAAAYLLTRVNVLEVADA